MNTCVRKFMYVCARVSTLVRAIIDERCTYVVREYVRTCVRALVVDICMYAM